MGTALEVHASMTATQAPPEAATQAAPASSTAPAGLARLLGSTDHKVIGRLYLGTALAFGVASVVTGVITGIDRIDGDLGGVVGSSSTSQLFTFHITSSALLFLMPAIIGVAMVVVPLQVGARAVAFPRAAAASYWGFLLGAALSATAYAIDGGPGGGRTEGVDLWITATGLVIVSLLLGAVSIATTVLTGRADGMTLDRVPMFTWSLLCTSVIWLLTLPVALASLIILYIDHRYGPSFTGASGDLMHQQVSWVVQQPQVYALAIPVLGVALDTVSTAVGRGIPQRGAARTLIGAFAILGIGAFALTAIDPAAADQPVTKGMALLAPLPVLGIIGLVGLTLKEGRPRPTSGMVGGVVALPILLLATLVGAATPFEGALELAGTQWETAQTHLTMGAVTVALLAALYHWSTKILGRSGSEALGRTAPLILGLGAVVIGVAEAITGLSGDAAEAANGTEALNAVALGGGVIAAVGAAIAVAGLLGGRDDDEAPADPWGCRTLEWATASPPSFANFDGDVPEVTSAEPLGAGADADGGDA